MKRLVHIVILTAAAVLLLLGLQGIFHLQGSQTLILAAVLIAAVIIGTVLYNYLHNARYAREMQALAPLLESGKAEEYVQKTRELLTRAKGKQVRTILNINLTSGLMECKQYNEAYKVLTEMDPASLTTSEFKFCYYLNLCMCCIYTKRTEEAHKICMDNRKLFDLWRKSPVYGGSVELLDVINTFCWGEKEKALSLLEECKNGSHSPRVQQEILDLENQLRKM